MVADMSVTIKELASQLRISPATVSLALNNDKRVAEETAKSVKKLATKLNYIPNNFGRGLQSRRSRLIGYLLNGVTASFHNEILQGVGESCVKAQYGLLVGIVSSDSDSLRDQIRLCLEKNIEGLILSLDIPKETISLLERHNVPFVFCSVHNPTAKGLSVKNDDFMGGRLAAEHLVKLGHRFCACCTAYEERLQGNLAVLTESNCAEPVFFLKAEELENIMKQPKRPTAIIAYSDFQAIKIMHIMKKIGLRIPEDVSLVGTDGLWFTELPEFSFTTIVQSRKEIGEKSVDLLFRIINGEEVKSVFLPPKLVARNSTAALKK